LIVADASAVLEVLLNPPSATEIAQSLFAVGETIHVPHVIDLEVLQVLRRYARSEMSSSRVEKARQVYGDIPLKRYSHKVLAPRIWGLRHNFTAYDAAYIALAEALDAPLITCDRALASNAGHRAKILLF
jgi:predicted nucleic acid-binding protein